jgi:ATP-binding cassette subfamily F protein uup
MKDFLFRPEQAKTPVKALSGGERGRLMLARALAKPSNLMVLDEPTNDLDLETLDLLQEMLAAYPGTLILDRVATSVIVSEGAARWQEYAGGYSDMLAQRGAPPSLEPPADVAEKPKAALPATPSAPKPKRKLSFAEQHALKTLPGRIEKLTAEQKRLEEILSAPDLYRKDPTAFTKATMALAMTRADLTRAEEDWLRTELLREELEANTDIKL